MEIGSAEWTRLKETIVSEFIPGQLIKHEWLWTAFRLEDFSRAEFGDYEKPADLIAAVKKADMDYMDFVSELRHELLVERKGLWSTYSVRDTVCCLPTNRSGMRSISLSVWLTG